MFYYYLLEHLNFRTTCSFEVFAALNNAISCFRHDFRTIRKYDFDSLIFLPIQNNGFLFVPVYYYFYYIFFEL